MGNRIIKESILTSETIGSLDDFAFRLFVSLIVLADDYGRGKSNPAIIRGQAFAMKDYSIQTVENGLQELANAGAIALYEVEGTRYFYFPKWEKHQTIRNKHSKFPAPSEASATICKQLQANASNCMSEQEQEQEQESNPNRIQSKGNSVPTYDEVKTEIEQKGYKTDPDKFFGYYDSVGWKIKGQPITNWKSMLACWGKADENKKATPKCCGAGEAEKEWAEIANKHYKL